MKKTVDLNVLVDALDLQSQEGSSFLDRETGEVYQLGPEELALGDRELLPSDIPDWQLPLVELARRVLSDSSDRFVELPDMWEINEFHALDRFASSQADPEVAAELRSAITGRGAFRRFKDAVHRLGIEERWYTYRHGYLLEIARDWCLEHDVPCTSPES